MIPQIQIALQVAVACILGYATYALLARRVPALRRLDGAGAAEVMLLSLVGFVAFSTAMMIGNIVTGGAVFGVAWIVPAAALVVVVLGLGDLAPRVGSIVFTSSSLRRSAPWVLAGVVLGWLYVWPMLEAGSGARTGDVPSHLGWTAQLLGGEPVPVGAAPEVPDNAYPWGLHAVMATLVRSVPGTEALAAVDALHVLIVVALPLAAACLARRVRPDAGWAAAGCFALIGGFGWLSSSGPAFVLSPTEARYGADLVVASPNSLYELFPPSSPRELGLALLGATGVLLILARGSEETRLWALAGVCAGLTGLVSVPLFLCALVWIGVIALSSPRGRRMAPLLISVAPGLALFALWVGPVIAGYLKYGGFVDITARLGVEWELGQALLSWGSLLPLAIGGTLLCVRGWRGSSKSEPGHALALLGLATALLLALAYARRAFDWAIASNATILHMGRFWPALHLLGAALGGLALLWLFRMARKRSPSLSVALVAVLLGVGAISPVYATIELKKVIDAGEDGYMYGEGSLGPHSFVHEAAEHLGPDDVLLVEGPPDLAYGIFQFSGVRLADYDDERFERNDLRIRYEDLAREWDEVAATGGYEPDYIVEPQRGPTPGSTIVFGTFSGEPWRLVPAP